jgi:hypothetical protein
MVDQLKALFKREYKIACDNVVEARLLREKHIKFPKWKSFGLPLKLVQGSFGWSYKHLQRIIMQAGYLIQNDFVVQNQVVTGSVFVALEEYKEEVQQVLYSDVVKPDTERDKKGAKKVLRKLDDEGGAASKAVPKVDVQWHPVPKKLKSFFEIVKYECKDLRPKVLAPDMFWALLTTNTFSIDRETHFRLKFDFDQVDVQQGALGQIVRTLVSLHVQDWSSGWKGDEFTETPIELCEVCGPNKEWNKKVLKNSLNGYFFPQGSVPLFLMEDARGLVVTPQDQLERERKRREVVQTYFAFGRPNLEDKNWYEEEKKTQYHATRTPLVEQNFEVIELPYQYDAFNMGNLCANDGEEEIFTDVCSGEEGGEEAPERAEEAEEGGEQAVSNKDLFYPILQELQKLSARVSSLEASGGPPC